MQLTEVVFVLISLVRYLLLGGPSAVVCLVRRVPGLSLPLEEFLVSLARVHTDLQGGLPWRIKMHL